MALSNFVDRNFRWPFNTGNRNLLRDTLNAIINAANQFVGQDTATLTPPTVVSGAIDPTKRVSLISSTGAQAFTLAAPAVGVAAQLLAIGTRVVLRCTVSTGTGTVTPAAVLGFATVAFTAAGQSAELIWNGTAWIIGINAGATIA